VTTINLDRVWFASEDHSLHTIPDLVWRLAAKEYVTNARDLRNGLASDLRKLRRNARRKSIPALLVTLTYKPLFYELRSLRVTLPAVHRQIASLEASIDAYQHPSRSERIRREQMLCGEQDALYEKNHHDETQLKILKRVLDVLRPH
jgi:hypothetical protein